MSANPTTASVPKSSGYNKNPPTSAAAPLVSLSSASPNNNSYSKYTSSSPSPHHHLPPTSVAAHPGLLPIGQPVNSMLAISGGLLPIDHFRLKLYNYAMAERLRCTGYPPGHGPPQMPLCPQPLPVGENPAQRVAAAAMMGQYGPGLALSMSLFQNRMFSSAEEPKPQHSYIGLIAIAILGSPECKMVLSDIYQHILDNYPYFRSRGPGWRNSIRHNLSLNDCFVKAGRSANGKGHYWAVHPANVDDFKKGDFRRRKAQRKVRKHMGLAVDDAGTDSPSPPPITDPFTNPWSIPHVPGMDLISSNASLYHPTATTNPHSAFQLSQTMAHTLHQQQPSFTSDPFHQNLLQRHQQHLQMISSKLSSRKRQFDVASLLAPDDQQQHEIPAKRSYPDISANEDSNEGIQTTTIIQTTSDVEENIDVEANDAIDQEDDTDEDRDSTHREPSPEMNSYFSNSTSSKFEVHNQPQSAIIKDPTLKRRRLMLGEREREDEVEEHHRNKFPWHGVIPMHKSLSVGFEKSLLERYYSGQQHHHHNHHHHQQHPSAMEDAHSSTPSGDGKKCHPSN